MGRRPGDIVAQAEPAAEPPEEGAALRYVVGLLVDIRAKAGEGKFASLLFIAYGIVTLQVLGLARYDVTKAVSVLDAASLADLLLVVPAVALLSVVGYVLVSSALCFAIGKVVISRASTGADFRAGARAGTESGLRA